MTWRRTAAALALWWTESSLNRTTISSVGYCLYSIHSTLTHAGCLSNGTSSLFRWQWNRVGAEPNSMLLSCMCKTGTEVLDAVWCLTQFFNHNAQKGVLFFFTECSILKDTFIAARSCCRSSKLFRILHVASVSKPLQVVFKHNLVHHWFVAVHSKDLY